MHGKERAIIPVLERSVGVRCNFAAHLNTDAFGTFTGEIPRVLSPLEAARGKCELCHLETGADLVVASEGSFGPHPVIGFFPVNEELLLLKDFKNDFEIHVSHLSGATNFASSEIYDETSLNDFLLNCGFPSHSVIVRIPEEGGVKILKDITDRNVFLKLLNEKGKLLLETDMRAFRNPTRMTVIQQTAELLAERMNTLCPSCAVPGFGVKYSVPGLHCSGCGSETRSILKNVLGCICCSYTEEHYYPKGKKTEEPMYCDICNP
jgi:hypothetical protein